MPSPWLADLESSLAADPESENLALALVVLAAVAGREVALDESEAHGVSRRALLLLAAGGDPSRGLDLNGRAVTAMADDLDAEEYRGDLARGLVELREEAEGLPHVSEAIHALLEEPDIAWRAYACSLLAEELSDDE